MIFGLLAPVAVVAGSASAADVFQICSQGGQRTDVCQDANNSGNPFIKTLRTAISILALLIGIAAVGTLIFGGLKLITAQGDASAIKNARDTVIYALVGLAVAALAQAIVAFVLNKL